MKDFIEPDVMERAFTCPHCNVLSNVMWEVKEILRRTNSVHLCDPTCNAGTKVRVSCCVACGKVHLWLDDKMIYPIQSNIQIPHPDMPETVKEIYEEARAVYPHSKRASAALLRLAIQVLCKELGEKGKNINEDIGSLVQKGLSVQIQQALDSIRVIGNNAVHPGQIDLNDENEVAAILFSLVNFIVEQLIAQPKQIQQLYGMLPQGALENINKRDSK